MFHSSNRPFGHGGAEVTYAAGATGPDLQIDGHVVEVGVGRIGYLVPEKVAKVLRKKGNE
jgi:hypothetical protein